MKIVINGNFMSRRVTGIERYAREITSALDKLLNNEDDVTLLIPSTAKDLPQYTKIKILQTKTKGGLLWEQTTLRSYMRKHRDYTCLNLCNVAPLFVQPGITVIHDIMCKVNKDDFTSWRNRLSRYWHVFQYWYITRHEKQTLTVSDFSRREIENHYKIKGGGVHVVPDAWQHVLKYRENEDWKKSYPFLRECEFFFSMATLSRNKNRKWIMEVAKRNPNLIFAVAGKYYEAEYNEIPENVYMLGYVSDEDACSLIKNCRAFIFPSLYEGFGLPPLEALGLGTEVIASNTTSLPEILGNSVHYINPLNYNVDFEMLLKEKIDDRHKALSRYNWMVSASLLYYLLKC